MPGPHEKRVGVPDEPNVDGAPPRRCVLEDARPQLAGVCHGSVEVEDSPGDPRRCERRPDSVQSLFGFVARTVTASQPSDVADDTVDARDDHAARERHLNRDDEVEAVHEERASCGLFGILLASGASSVLCCRADAALESESLARFELMMIADEADCRRTSVAAVEQPGDILRRSAEPGKLLRAEEACVVRVDPLVLHACIVFVGASVSITVAASAARGAGTGAASKSLTRRPRPSAPLPRDSGMASSAASISCADAKRASGSRASARAMNLAQRSSSVGAEDRDRQHLVVEEREEGRRRVAGREEPSLGEQLPGDDADREKVGTRVERLGAGLLGRHVPGVPRDVLGERLARVGEASRDAEIGELDLAVRRDEHVRWAQVAVDDAKGAPVGAARALMRVGESAEDLAQHVPDELGRQRLGPSCAASSRRGSCPSTYSMTRKYESSMRPKSSTWTIAGCARRAESFASSRKASTKRSVAARCGWIRFTATRRSNPPSGQYTASNTKPMPPWAISRTRRYLPKRFCARTVLSARPIAPNIPRARIAQSTPLAAIVSARVACMDGCAKSGASGGRCRRRIAKYTAGNSDRAREPVREAQERPQSCDADEHEREEDDRGNPRTERVHGALAGCDEEHRYPGERCSR